MHVHLFVEILNHYLYYFETECAVITEKYIRSPHLLRNATRSPAPHTSLLDPSGLIALINEHVENMEASEQRSEVEAHFQNTLAHIKGMQQAEKTKEKFEGIVLFQDKGAV
jgi:vacuolar protein sorting-associated protein 35